MSRPQTHVEYEILEHDAARGILYPTFHEFWEKRMEPMQYIPREAKGVLGQLRAKLREQAEQQYRLWQENWKQPELPPMPIGTGIAL